MFWELWVGGCRVCGCVMVGVCVGKWVCGCVWVSVFVRRKASLPPSAYFTCSYLLISFNLSQLELKWARLKSMMHRENFSRPRKQHEKISQRQQDEFCQALGNQ